MEKKFKPYFISLIFSLVIFNVIVFVTPNEIAGTSKFTPLFWIAYLMITLTFIVQCICTYTFFKETNIEKLFLNLPLLTVSYSSLVATLITGGICMAVPIIPTWLGIIVCTLISGYYIISLSQAKTAAEVIYDIDVRIKENTFFMKSALNDVEILLTEVNDTQVKQKLTALADELRYSDPVSNLVLREIELKIEEKLSRLQVAVQKSDNSNICSLSDEIILLTKQRNKKCKLLKN